MIEIRIANEDDIDNLVSVVGQYHQFESIDSSSEHRREALAPLLTANSSCGFVLLASSKDKVIGYMVICFGYSIECGGREAFIDEFYLLEKSRNQGVGATLFAAAKTQAKQNSIRVIHLEIAQNNHRAKSFYVKQGFYSRDQRFNVMQLIVNIP